MWNKTKKGIPFILSAPAGTGKTTLVRRLMQEFSHVKASISYTTRPPRPNEVDGVDYFFISEKLFQQKIDQGEFLEHASLFGYHYGTSKETLAQELEKGFHVVMVIDTQGALIVKDKIAAPMIFIFPPSFQELRERLFKRLTDSKEAIEERLSWAQHEVEVAAFYDYRIVNEDLDTAYEVLRSIIIAEEHKHH